MLLITRKIGESVWIDGAQVWIKEIDRGVVKLAIDAPKHVHIVRDEIKGTPKREGK